MGAVLGGAVRGSQEHRTAGPGRERRPRRDDPDLELLSVGRKSAERRPPRLSGLRTRFTLPVSRVVHAAGIGFPGVRLAFCTVLSRRGTRACLFATPSRTTSSRWTDEFPLADD